MAKGQAFLSDFSISMAVFGIVLVAFFIPWNSIIEADTRFSQSEEMKTDAGRIASFLVNTEGYPNNWEKDDVKVVVPGFATEDNVLSMQKMLEFASLEYEDQRSLLKSQGFSMNFVDSETGETLAFDRSQYEGEKLASYLGSDPIAYMVQSGTSLSELEMLDNLNSSDREWHFYFPSEEDQDQLSSLTAEEVYTNSGDGPPMMERMIVDAGDKGYNKFRIGERVEAASTSEITDIDGDGGKEFFYKDGDDRLNIYDIDDRRKRLIETVPEFAGMGAVDDFAETEGDELAYINDDDQLTFYSLEDDEITETSQSAIDIGDATKVGGEQALFLIDGDNNLVYYTESGVTETSVNGQRVGGAGDIDDEGNTEIAFMDGNDDLGFYEPEEGSEKSTGFQITDVGWIYQDSVAVISNSNDHFGLWNNTDSSFENSEVSAESVSDYREIEGIPSVLFIDTQRNQDLAFYDSDAGIRRYLRTGESQDIRASEGGWEVDIPGYGQSFAYVDGSGYINFYIRSQDTTAHLRQRAQYLGGAGDVDNDGVEELVYIDNDNRNLDYYEFEQGTSIVAQEDGSNVRGKEIGVPADLDNDDSVETPYMTDNGFLGYYDYQDDQVTEFNSLGKIETLGGTEDIEREGNHEIIYISDGTVQYYDPVDDVNTDTGRQASYAGGAADITGNSELEIVYRNADQQVEYYNPDTDSATEETTRIRRPGSVTQLNKDDGYDGIITNQNSRLGYFDFSLSLNYNTVIAENVDVQPGNIENDEILRSAVEAGMTYLHTRNDISMLSETFGMNTQDPGSDNAEIQKVEPLLNSEEFSKEDEISFSNVQGGFQNVGTVFANSTGDPASCMACMQKFGDGKVYYLAGMELEGIDKQSAFSDINSAIRSTDERINPFDTGKDIPDTAETVVVVKRQVVINKSGEFEKAELRLKSWR